MKKIDILDHGYLGLVEHWGADERIVEAARMSTAKGFLGWGPKCLDCGAQKPGGRCLHCGCLTSASGDERLLRFLYENAHSSPFEFAGMIVEVQAPIFVFREWHRHRTQSYSEMSARYTPLPDFSYIPSLERVLVGLDGSNKQAGTIPGAGTLTPELAEEFRSRLLRMYEAQQEFYTWALGIGVPKELARIDLPVGRYSRMRASANLRNWLAFLTLRMAPNAQWEIRQFANAMSDLVQTIFPRTHELFVEQREKGKG